MQSVPRPAQEPALPFSQRPALLSAWLSARAARDRRSAPRLLRLLLGALLAQGRRTVTRWSRPAGITADCRRAYSALRAAGRRAADRSARLLCGTLKPLMAQAPGGRLLFALGDTPTARPGPCAQGAGVHHHPSPGPAGEQSVYGPAWVTLAWLAHPPAWPTLALPLRALLYVRP